jgi:hypothetical protein
VRHFQLFVVAVEQFLFDARAKFTASQGVSDGARGE